MRMTTWFTAMIPGGGGPVVGGGGEGAGAVVAPVMPVLPQLPAPRQPANTMASAIPARRDLNPEPMCSQLLVGFRVRCCGPAAKLAGGLVLREIRSLRGHKAPV